MTELINSTTITTSEPEADLGALGLGDESQGIVHDSRSPLRLALRRFRRNWVAMAALVVLVIVVFLCLFPSIPARYGQSERLPVTDTTYINAPPSAEAWFGTDDLNRDLYSRVFYGGQTSILIGVSVAVIACLIGTLVGAVAGYRGGKLDDILMRITDIFLAFPILVTLLVLRNVLSEVPYVDTVMGDKTSIRFMVIMLSVVGWMAVARIVRGEVLSLKQREFVEAGAVARRLGTADHVQAPDPQFAGSDHGGPEPVGRHRHPRRVDPVVLRLRAEPGRGAHDVGSPDRPVEADDPVRLLVAGRVPVPVPRRDDRCHQLRRRRVARLLRSEGQEGAGVTVDLSGDGQTLEPIVASEATDHVVDRPVVLEIRDLHVTFPTESGDVQAVRGVDVTVHEGELLGVVGESGSGKSVTFLAAMGLLPKSARTEGSVKIRGQELIGEKRKLVQRARGKRIAMIFQDPLSALNPTHKVGSQVAEMVRSHQEMSKEQAAKRAVELLDMVGIPQPTTRARQYPHEFSGGMRQRVMIAMAIANDPEVLIADEPTTALDVTVQAQILEVVQRIQKELGTAVVFITHDLGVVARIADRLQVMYAGRAVERGEVRDLFTRPTHPYTKGLLASLPAIGRERLTPIPGAPPNMLAPPSGCAFRARCAFAIAACAGDIPELQPFGVVETACIRAEELLDVAVGDAP